MRRRALGWAGIAVYAAALVALTLQPVGVDRPAHVNVVPLRSIASTVTGPLGLGGTAYVLLGNLLLLTPLAAIVAWAFPRLRTAGAVGALVATSLAVEILQLVLRTGHVTDVDNLLLNVSGGVAVYLAIRGRRGHEPCPHR